MYTRVQKEKTLDVIRIFKPWWDAYLRYPKSDGTIAEHHRHNSCREGFLNEAHHFFAGTWPKLYDVYNDKSVNCTVAPSATKGELKCQDPKQFATNVAKATRPFYILLWNDEQAKQWMAQNSPGKYGTTGDGMTSVSLPMRPFYDPELVSLFMGLWRCVYAIDGTKYAAELDALVSDTELKAIQSGDVKAARTAAHNVAKFFAGIWTTGHSPISSANLEHVNRMIESRKIGTRYALSNYKSGWKEGTSSAQMYGFHDNTIRKFVKKVATPVTPAAGVKKVVRRK